jgi:hypothetical protein
VRGSIPLPGVASLWGKQSTNQPTMNNKQFQDEMETIIEGFLLNNCDELREQFVEEFGDENYRNFDWNFSVTTVAD